jgi:hypothetical protein
VRCAKVEHNTEAYLLAASRTLEWSDIGRAYDATEQTATHFRCTLISIWPTVVVMTLQHSPVPQSPLKGSTLGPRPVPQFKWRSKPSGVNYLGYGTTLPPADEGLWFSPDLKVPPTPVSLRGSTAEIPIGKDRLLLERDADGWRVTRVR